MRVVRTLADLPGEVAKAEAEAESAFGDGTVFVEPYVEHGRHVEVQVLGHRDGVLVLGERDCSIQRRHQKVVEEAPAPNLADRTRAALHEAARAAAAAIDYRGAGTVEFLYDAETERFFFLEMNTRLQVEHPVTELVHGVDLVEAQLTVAEGRPLDLRVIGETYGHAIEVRLYAEDPAHDWQPQSGVLTRFEVPGVSGEFDLLNRPGLRVDSGFESGSEVSTHYDAMLAKVIAWAPSRQEAARKLVDALAKARLHGLVTNRDLLVEILRHDTFLSGEVSTDFFERTAVIESSTPGDPDPHLLFAAAVATGRTGPGASTGPAGGPGRVAQRGRPSRNAPSSPSATPSTSSSGTEGATATPLRPTMCGSCRSHRPRSCCRSRTSASASRWRSVPAKRFPSTVPWDPLSCAPYPGSWIPPTSSRRVRCSRRCRAPSSSYPSRTAPRSPPASRCWCSRR